MNTSAKIFSLPELMQRLAFWRTLGDTIVFTNGCFDILHPGHVHLLQTCRSFGDRVIVGLNADVSVKRLKGEKRPVNNEQSRAIILAALSATDAIILFEEDTPEQLIHHIKPDVLVKGGDWKKEEIVGNSFVQSYGGKTEVVPYLSGHSTTSIIERSK
ncbi:MAG: D-glycero-beta-D-manno-heptose 1-phosphate adenylyltransferase [Chitinophagales bacterium]|nr:D-glycero-beta-D-manno-heptose 1-phosphate adenylyltransferase [Chitinophagales bacterium]